MNIYNKVSFYIEYYYEIIRTGSRFPLLACAHGPARMQSHLPSTRMPCAMASITNCRSFFESCVSFILTSASLFCIFT